MRVPNTGLRVVKKRIQGKWKYRIYEGKLPMGEDQVPPRPTDGGGFDTESDARALMVQIIRRREQKAL